MAHFFLQIGWFGRPGGRNEASNSPAGLKGNPGVEARKTPSEDHLNIQEYVYDSIQRGAYVDFEQLRRLVGPPLETKGVKCAQFLDWTICWQMYRSMVLEVHPERETELQMYGDTIENLFLLSKPQVHSLIVELDKAERKRIGGFVEDTNAILFGDSSDTIITHGEEKRENLHVQVRGSGVSLGGQTLGASTMHRLQSAYSLAFWRAIARSLFKLVTFSAFT